MKYLILLGQYTGSVRDFGSMDESAQRRRKLFAIEDYESYKALDEVGKALFLANAQKKRWIELSEEDKKKAVAVAATSQVEKESSEVIEVVIEKAITESDTIETINTESAEELTSVAESETPEVQTKESVVAENETTANIEELRAEYLAKTGNKVPPRFSNNADWIKTKL